ncbi:MAG TPA: hypothetical protein VHE57_10890 [Mycobacteriales bacterium]|nr:hypothetical protein [Mycobacteriales bacterium]
MTVWRRPQPHDKQSRTYVLAGRTEFYISVSGPSSAGATTVLPAAKVVNIALRRIAQHG